MSLVLDEHRQYLADAARISAFRRAIVETVGPGHVVLDLGCGTGILGLLACQAGAARVYSVESEGMIELAREISRTNGYDDRISFIKGLSTRISLPERVDAVISDQIGRFGFEANLIEYLSDARLRFLKPGGITMPSAVDLWVAPVECPEFFSSVEFWSGFPAGFDFHPARAIAANTGYPVRFAPEQLLGEPVLAGALNLTSATVPLKFDVTAAVRRTGVLHGVGGWFAAQLSPNVVMTNSPIAADRINRRNVFFPIERAVDVAEGDSVRVVMHVLPSELTVAWTVHVLRTQSPERRSTPSELKFVHSTWRGMLMCREDLRRTHPESTPRLSPWGVARLSVLNLCDGQRTLGEVEREVHRRHPDLFPSRRHASEFVAEVVTRYSL